MDEHELTGQLPQEVVEVYRQPEYREVVEVYTRPLPASMVPKPVPEQPAPTKKRRKKWPWILLGCMTAIAVLLLALWGVSRLWMWQMMPGYSPYFPAFEEQEPAGEITIPTWPTGQGAELTVHRNHGEAVSIQEVYRRVNPAVVTVMNIAEGGYYVGTGVIFTEDGYILTNHHVLQGGSECVVALENDARYQAMYVAGDAKHDLAVLKIEAEGLPAAEFGDSDQLTVGDPAYAIGNPLGVDLRGTLTDGIISAISRDVLVGDRTMTLLQTNAALNSGNSGGPLINQYGQVVGINVVKLSAAMYQDTSVEGLGFAIPTSTLERVVNDLLTYGEVRPEPLLGISVYNTPTEVEDGLWGAGVESVTPGGAGDRAGILPGDYILSSGETPLTTSSDVLKERRKYHVGDEMPMTVWRNGEILEVTLQLTEAAE